MSQAHRFAFASACLVLTACGDRQTPAGSGGAASVAGTSSGSGGAGSSGTSGNGGAAGSAGGPAGTAGMAGVAGTAGMGAMAGMAGMAGMGGTAGTASGAGGNGGGSGGSAGCTPFAMPSDCTIPANAVLPSELRCTGLYGDWEARALACGVSAYAPAYALWSDGADKQRYVALPEGMAVDVSDPDAFLFPVGTSFWKEFRLTDGRRAETRLLRKSEAGWIYTSYVWTEDETNAVQNNDGVPNLYESGHTVPSRAQCKECHAGRPDYVLGWDAFLLGPGATGITRETLLERDLVEWDGRESGTPNPLTVTVPGDDVERAALGYLHANCGASCHNDTSAALALESGLFLNLDADLTGSVQESPAFATGNGRTPSPNAPLQGLPTPAAGPFVDLRPLDPERSLLVARMNVRGVDAQMPRVATNRVDADGVAKVVAWIEQMTVERGYPAPAP
jgi:hypothetical protein